jgi:tRNA threonylcarbamoyladenosine biosynthesis protein TsaE
MSPLIIETHSVEETQAVGRRLGAVLAPGDVIALVGALGAGKTTLVKGIADGAGVGDPRQVTSPTFIIVNEYEASPERPAGEEGAGVGGRGSGEFSVEGSEFSVPRRRQQTENCELRAQNSSPRPPASPLAGLRIYHVDAYRLRGSTDLEALGFDEMYVQGAVVIEWADRVSDVLPPDHLSVALEPVGDFQRRLICTAAGQRSRRLLEALGRETDPLSC